MSDLNLIPKCPDCQKPVVSCLAGVELDELGFRLRFTYSRNIGTNAERQVGSHESQDADMQPLNTALLLYMVDQAAPVWGRTKVQKTAFFAEFGLQETGAVATTFPFKRYLKEPWSQDAWNSLDYLTEAGFLRDEDYGPTERGLFLIDLIETLREDNQETFKVLDGILRHCKARSGTQLMDEAYELEFEPIGMPGKKLKLRDVPQEQQLLAPSETTIRISKGMLELIEDELMMTDEQLSDAMDRVDQIAERQVSRIRRRWV